MKFPKNEIPLEVLREYLHYDPATGHLTWLKKLSVKVVVGRRAGTQVRNRDNRIIKIFGEVYIEHRLIWFYVTGVWPKKNEHIDHIDHNEANNSWENLRLVSQAENNKNLSKRSTNSSGVTGVWLNKRNRKNPFVAEIWENGCKKSKGFPDLDSAISCRKAWEAELNFHPNHGINKPT